MPFLVLGIIWVSKTRESNYLHRDAHGSAVTLAMDIIAKTVRASYRQVKLTRFNTFLTHFNASCVLANAHEC